MANKNASKKITQATLKIANVADFILGEEGHDWQVDELHLVPKSGPGKDKIVCKYELVNGEYVLKCTKG